VGDGVRVDVHALARGLAPGEVVCGDPLAAYLRAALPATAEVQGACSNDEHRERGQEKRRPEDGPDADLARGLRVPSSEHGGQDGNHGNHGLRQRGADGGEHAPHRSLAQVQPAAQDLHRIRAKRRRRSHQARAQTRGIRARQILPCSSTASITAPAREETPPDGVVLESRDVTGSGRSRIRGGAYERGHFRHPPRHGHLR
jgi:hypothetical protein